MVDKRNTAKNCKLFCVILCACLSRAKIRFYTFYTFICTCVLQILLCMYHLLIS